MTESAVQMLSCGIPELSDQEDLKYVYDALRPHESEADATMYFTRYRHTHTHTGKPFLVKVKVTPVKIFK